MFERWLDFIPFVLASTATHGPRPNIARLIELAIIAGASAFGAYQAIQSKIENVQNDVVVVKQQVLEVKDDIKEMKKVIYVPRVK